MYSLGMKVSVPLLFLMPVLLGCSRPTDLQVSYYPDGSPQESVSLLEDTQVRHGPYMSWHRTSIIAEEGKYSNGVRVGSWEWRDSEGRLTIEGEFDSSGVKVGRWRTWEMGAQASDVVFGKNGALNGPFAEWRNERSRFQSDAISKVELRGTVMDGARVGAWLEVVVESNSQERPFWNGTVVELEGEFDLENKKNGRWEIRIPTMTKILQERGLVGTLGGDFYGGRKVGPWIEWSPSSNFMVGEYLEGEKHGQWTFSTYIDWRENGGFVHQAIYQGGLLSNGVQIASEWDASEEDLPPGTTVGSEGVYRVAVLRKRNDTLEIVYPEFFCNLEALDTAVAARIRGLESAPGLLAKHYIHSVPYLGNKWSSALPGSLPEMVQDKNVHEWRVYSNGELSEAQSGVYLNTARILDLSGSWR